MLVRSWLDALKSRFTRLPTRRQRRAAGLARLLHVESLEDRRLMAFNPAVNYSAGLNPGGPVAGLINADAALDLVMANYPDNTVSVLLNQGDGSFAAAASYPVGTSPFGLATGDFNRDGRADVVTANYDGNNVSVLLNQGNGTLGTAVSYAAGTAPTRVAVADLNGDSKLDLAVTNYNNSNTVSLLLGNGDGTFQAARALAAGDDPYSVVVRDFDGDHKLDLATANFSGNSVSVFKGDGLGNFAVPKYSSVPGPASLAVSDVNKDGTLDLLVAGAGQANVLIGQGDGTFAAGASFQLGSTIMYGIAAPDFNGDGWDDFAVSDRDAGGVNVYLNQGDGSWFFEGFHTIGAPTSGLTAADLNGDSRPDLAVAKTWGNGNSISVLINDAVWQLGFNHAVNYPVGLNPYSVAAGLINPDSARDLVTANYSDSTVSVLLNQGTGSFAAAASYPVGPSPYGVATGDFNGDGRADVVTANFAGNNVSVLLSQANGTLGTAVNYSAGTAPISVAMGDFNGDTKLDLAVANYNGNDVSVLLGNGAGGFGAARNFVTGYNPRSVVVGDFDGDHKLDLATANEGGYSVSMLAGDGLGSFAAPRDSSVPGASVPVDPPTSLAVGDVNQDGTLDLLAAGSEHTEFLFCDPYGCAGGFWETHGLASVLIGRGDGTFTAGATFRLGSDFEGDPLLKSVPYGIAAADFNGDGWDDFAVDNGDAGGVNVYLNVGDGSFFDGGVFATGAGPAGLTAADLNGDSRPDLAVANLDGNSMSVLINAADWHSWLRIEGVTVTERNSGTTNADFTVRIWPAPTQTVTVSYSTVDGSATAGSDYVAAFGTLTFSPGGPLSQKVTVAVKGDAVWEYDENFSVQISAVGATILNAYGYGTIVNDEPLISISDASVTEGNTGTRTVTFSVSLSAAYDGTVTVNYTTANGTAAAPSDYTAASGTLTFAPGEISKPVTVLVNGDRLPEPDEMFVVNLSNATGAALADGQGVCTIVDDEPRLSINSVSLAEGNGGTKLMTFTVTLSAAYDEAVTVNYATFDVSAVAGQDYVATSGTLTFSPGQTSKTITVAIKGDKTKEDDEYFYMVLSDASDNALLNNSTGSGTIRNDDSVKGLRR